MARSKNMFDVMIIGGGLSGGTLACLLGSKGLRVCCIDRDPPASQISESFDGRTTAISWGSHMILTSAGVWDMLRQSCCPIRMIDILDGGSPVLLRFGSAEVENQSFGWIVENRLLRFALFSRMKSLGGIRHIAPAQVESIDRNTDVVRARLDDGQILEAPLLVGADGRESFVREWAGIGLRGWPYHQTAIICNVEHEHPHHNVAVEHFRAEGPFAILPLTDGDNGAHRSSVVWTEHGRNSASILRSTQAVFDAGLNARFPDQYGRIRQIGRRAAYPLTLQHAYRYTAERVALVADAAHGIHPIAGQGLNLGFRDIDALATLLKNAHENGEDIGCAAVLGQYDRHRRFDNMAMAGATDALTRLFSNDVPGLPLVRKAGLRMVARLPRVKRFFMHQAMGRKVR